MRWFVRLALWVLASAPALIAGQAPVRGSPQWFFATVPQQASTDLMSREGQQYLQALHAVGRHDWHAAFPSRFITPAACRPWPGSRSESRSVIDELVELARSTRVVIINEAHDESRHREIVRQLAIALRPAGYAYYAAEAFSPQADRHPDEAFGRTDAGYYTLEPTFGQLLRSAKELGYRLVPYERLGPPTEPSDRAAAVVEREEAQLNNLLERIFNVTDDARVLIHVGYSHAAEVPLPTFGAEVEWLAARLKAKTGIDPLTIDQVRCAARGDALELTQISADLPTGAHDVAIAHPQTTLFRGRPQWRIDAGDIAIELPASFVVDDVRTLVEARYESEPVDAIPLDRLLLEPGESLPLLLRTGRIRVEQFFEDGRPPQTAVLVVR